MLRATQHAHAAAQRVARRNTRKTELIRDAEGVPSLRGAANQKKSKRQMAKEWLRGTEKPHSGFSEELAAHRAALEGHMKRIEELAVNQSQEPQELQKPQETQEPKPRKPQAKPIRLPKPPTKMPCIRPHISEKVVEQAAEALAIAASRAEAKRKPKTRKVAISKETKIIDHLGEQAPEGSTVVRFENVSEILQLLERMLDDGNASGKATEQMFEAAFVAMKEEIHGPFKAGFAQFARELSRAAQRGSEIGGEFQASLCAARETSAHLCQWEAAFGQKKFVREASAARQAEHNWGLWTHEADALVGGAGAKMERFDRVYERTKMLAVHLCQLYQVFCRRNGWCTLQECVAEEVYPAGYPSLREALEKHNEYLGTIMKECKRLREEMRGQLLHTALLGESKWGQAV